MTITPHPRAITVLCAGVLAAGGIVGLAVAADSPRPRHSITVDNPAAGNGPSCFGEAEQPQYAKWVRERDTVESPWGDWYLYDGGSVTSWSPGTGFLGPFMQYEYRPNGVTRTVEVEVECPTETTIPDTTEAPPSTPPSTSPTTEPSPSTTEPASTTSPATTVAPTSSESVPPSTPSVMPGPTAPTPGPADGGTIPTESSAPTTVQPATGLPATK